MMKRKELKMKKRKMKNPETQVMKVIRSCFTIGQWLGAYNYMIQALKVDFINDTEYSICNLELNNQLKKINQK